MSSINGVHCNIPRAFRDVNRATPKKYTIAKFYNTVSSLVSVNSIFIMQHNMPIFTMKHKWFDNISNSMAGKLFGRDKFGSRWNMPDEEDNLSGWPRWIWKFRPDSWDDNGPKGPPPGPTPVMVMPVGCGQNEAVARKPAPDIKPIPVQHF